MICKITDYKQVVYLLDLAEKFKQQSESVEYDKSAMLSAWEHILSNKIGVLLAYHKNNKIIGVIGGIKHPDITSGILTATETFWFVDPEYRGIGKSLLNAFEKWAKKEECKRIIMMALMDSMPKKVTKIYKDAGYRPLEISYIKEV